MHQGVADASFEDVHFAEVASPVEEEEEPWGSQVDGFRQAAGPAVPRSLPPSVVRLQRWRQAGAAAAVPQAGAAAAVPNVATVAADSAYERWWADKKAKAVSSGVAVAASLAAAADAVAQAAAANDEWQQPWQAGPYRNRSASPARDTGSSSSAAAAPPPPWRPAPAAQGAAPYPKRPACGQGSWTACLHSESGPFQRNDSLFSFFGSRGRVP